MTSVRRASREDIPLIISFIRALAAYENELDLVRITEQDLLRDAFGEHPVIYCLIAEHLGSPAGFALYYLNYSTWEGRPGIYLEDIFVLPELRGIGIGKRLLRHLAQIAMEMGCRRLQWQVLDWNAPAIEFYRSLGAQFMDRWRNVRLMNESVEELSRLAIRSAAEQIS
jgi:GNAT superfamily N-acetyltransferase